MNMFNSSFDVNDSVNSWCEENATLFLLIPQDQYEMLELVPDWRNSENSPRKSKEHSTVLPSQSCSSQLPKKDVLKIYWDAFPNSKRRKSDSEMDLSHNDSKQRGMSRSLTKVFKSKNHLLKYMEKDENTSMNTNLQRSLSEPGLNAVICSKNTNLPSDLQYILNNSVKDVDKIKASLLKEANRLRSLISKDLNLTKPEKCMSKTYALVVNKCVENNNETQSVDLDERNNVIAEVSDINSKIQYLEKNLSNGSLSNDSPKSQFIKPKLKRKLESKQKNSREDRCKLLKENLENNFNTNVISQQNICVSLENVPNNIENAGEEICSNLRSEPFNDNLHTIARVSDTNCNNISNQNLVIHNSISVQQHDESTFNAINTLKQPTAFAKPQMLTISNDMNAQIPMLQLPMHVSEPLAVNENILCRNQLVEPVHQPQLQCAESMAPRLSGKPVNSLISETRKTVYEDDSVSSIPCGQLPISQCSSSSTSTMESSKSKNLSIVHYAGLQEHAPNVLDIQQFSNVDLVQSKTKESMLLTAKKNLTHLFCPTTAQNGPSTSKTSADMINIQNQSLSRRNQNKEGSPLLKMVSEKLRAQKKLLAESEITFEYSQIKNMLDLIYELS